MDDKGIALLKFLKTVSGLRRRPAPSYRPQDRVLWLADVPRDRPECRSPFLAIGPDESPNYWLQVRKSRPPARPAAPNNVNGWLRPGELDSPTGEPELLQERTVLVEREVPDPEAPPDHPRTVVEEVSEVRRLSDHPEVEDAWLDYLVNRWEPWAEEMRDWQVAYDAYEDVDAMRRRLEEAEERYELFLGLGLLQWRDPHDRVIERHVLVGPAELEFNSARGVIRAVPAASFVTFRPELDMLEREDRPRLDDALLTEPLEDLETQAWDRQKVGAILRDIANRARSDAQVDDEALARRERTDDTLRVTYAPALVLRERRPTAFDEMIGSLLGTAEDGTLGDGSQPWEQFVAEGEGPPPQDRPPLAPVPGEQRASGDSGRLYFPLPTNEEQRRIIDRLQVSPCVVVKGPPGTGKSHSIANLLCHLLAKGERVLVTAHAPKALSVLRGMLPKDVRDLCVTALGSSGEDQELLGESVTGILSRENEWRGDLWAQPKIRETEERLETLEGQLAQTERELRECREAEVHQHHLPGGYVGTAGQIARRLEHEREGLGWFPASLRGAPAFPLDEGEVRLLTEEHGKLTQEVKDELSLDTCDGQLPDAEQVRELAAAIEAAERSAARVRDAADSETLRRLEASPTGELQSTAASIRALAAAHVRAQPVLGDLSARVLRDLLAGQTERWARVVEGATKALADMAVPLRCAGRARVVLPPDISKEGLLADAVRRLDHIRSGGRRGFLFLTPRVMKETRYVEVQCLVDGQPPREVQKLGELAAFLRVSVDLEDFASTWPGQFEAAGRDPRHAFTEAKELVSETEALLRTFDAQGVDCVPCIPASMRPDLVSASERDRWLAAIEALVATKEFQEAQRRLTGSSGALHACMDGRKAHPCVGKLIKAMDERNSAAWREAWDERQAIRARQERRRRYDQLLNRLSTESSPLVEAIRTSQGDPTWEARLLDLAKAWAWASARGWVDDRISTKRYEDLMRRSHRLLEDIEGKTEEAASLLAWRAFFRRLDDRTRQNLMGWTQAIDQLGAGTGVYAYRRRREARSYLVRCIPAIPGWIMPLHKLWETVDPRPGLFDTAIVDEASQAGVDSLALLLLAKRVIVVGDDKQNSPETGFVTDDEIEAASSKHLSDFHFRERFRPDTSLFDHALRAFPTLISLREHFRCVPEIIQFSNDNFYRDARLIPLRQVPRDRLPPLRSTFVDSGFCRKKGQRIQNPPEADAVVQAVRACIEDGAYEGKSIGVIVLQGHGQAELIGSRLAAELDPEVVRERKLRCGRAATFQGDQRDVVFLSVVISPEINFTSLTHRRYKRSFNVAMSRAKDQVWLFHSVQQHDLGPTCLRRKLLAFFQNPPQGASERVGEDPLRLEREARRPRRRPGEQPAPYDSWFEVDVALELLRRGYQVIPQYEVAEKRIDLVIEGTEARLAVECDGDAWHGPERYEHDMARQRQLERAEWTFVRVREFEFYADRRRVVEDIVRACEELSVYPAGGTPGTVAPGQRADAEREDATCPRDPGDERKETPKPDEEPEEPASEMASTEQGPFTGYSPDLAFPDPREAPIARVRDALRRIIEADGPLTRASVCRLYIEGCPHVARAGRAVRQALNRALGAMLRAGVIAQQDELGSGSAEGQIIRMSDGPQVRERPAGRRDLREIPPSELSLLLQRLDNGLLAEGQPNETLFRRVLEHYGFKRLTPVRLAYLEQVLGSGHRMVEEGAGPRPAHVRQQDLIDSP